MALSSKNYAIQTSTQQARGVAQAGYSMTPQAQHDAIALAQPSASGMTPQHNPNIVNISQIGSRQVQSKKGQSASLNRTQRANIQKINQPLVMNQNTRKRGESTQLSSNQANGKRMQNGYFYNGQQSGQDQSQYNQTSQQQQQPDLITQVAKGNNVQAPVEIQAAAKIPGSQNKFLKEAVPPHMAYLGPQLPHARGKKTLVLDLDETLVHSSFKPPAKPDIILPIEIEGNVCDVYVVVRPGTEYFLQRLAQFYEIVIYTASLSKYADPLVDILDSKPHKVIDFRLFREHCTWFQGVFIKDMSMVGRPLTDALIIDNSPTSYAFHQENALPILSWYDDPKDRALYDLIPLLEALAEVDDLRKYIPRFVTTDHRVDFMRASYIMQHAQMRSSNTGAVVQGVGLGTVVEENSLRPSPEQRTSACENPTTKPNNGGAGGAGGRVESIVQEQASNLEESQPDIEVNEEGDEPDETELVRKKNKSPAVRARKDTTPAVDEETPNLQFGRVYSKVDSPNQALLMNNTWTLDETKDERKEGATPSTPNEKIDSNSVPKTSTSHMSRDKQVAQGQNLYKVPSTSDRVVVQNQSVKTNKKKNQSYYQTSRQSHQLTDNSAMAQDLNHTATGTQIKGVLDEIRNECKVQNVKQTQMQLGPHQPVQRPVTRDSQRRGVQSQQPHFNNGSMPRTAQKSRKFQQFYSRQSQLQSLLQTDKLFKKSQDPSTSAQSENRPNISREDSSSVQRNKQSNPKQQTYLAKFYPNAANAGMSGSNQSSNQNLNYSQQITPTASNMATVKPLDLTPKQSQSASNSLTRGFQAESGGALHQKQRRQKRNLNQPIALTNQNSQTNTANTTLNDPEAQKQNGSLIFTRGQVTSPTAAGNLLNKRRHNSRQKLMLTNISQGKVNESASNVQSPQNGARPASAKKPAPLFNNFSPVNGTGLIKNNNMQTPSQAQKFGNLMQMYDQRSPYNPAYQRSGLEVSPQTSPQGSSKHGGRGLLRNFYRQSQPVKK